MDKDEVWQF